MSRTHVGAASIARVAQCPPRGGCKRRLLGTAARLAAVTLAADADDNAAILRGTLRCLAGCDGPVTPECIDDNSIRTDPLFDQKLGNSLSPLLGEFGISLAIRAVIVGMCLYHDRQIFMLPEPSCLGSDHGTATGTKLTARLGEEHPVASRRLKLEAEHLHAALVLQLTALSNNRVVQTGPSGACARGITVSTSGRRLGHLRSSWREETRLATARLVLNRPGGTRIAALPEQACQPFTSDICSGSLRIGLDQNFKPAPRQHDITLLERIAGVIENTCRRSPPVDNIGVFIRFGDSARPSLARRRFDLPLRPGGSGPIGGLSDACRRVHYHQGTK